MTTKKQAKGKAKSAKADKAEKPIIIRIEWDKESYLLPDFDTNKPPLTDNHGDWGLYQIYGEHPVYGSDALLYIGLCGGGKDTKQLLGKRIKQHSDLLHEPYLCDAQVYVGHLISENPDIKNEAARKEWADNIRRAEELLIFFHKPAYNSINIRRISEKPAGKNVRVFNFGNCRKLQGEVSSDYYREYNEQYTKDAFKPYRLPS